MNVKTKFDIGQEVWGLRKKSETHTVICPQCEGDGKLPTKAGKVTCPACEGWGYQSKTTAYLETTKVVIVGMRIDVYDQEIRVTYDTYECVYEEYDLFLDESLAIEESERRNEETQDGIN